LKQSIPALLALADGSLFYGTGVGVSSEISNTKLHHSQTPRSKTATTQAVGEVIFNTAITGYQEILTDPSYAQQLITLTYPHIGNVGTNPEDEESCQVWAAGLIIRDLSLIASNWRSKQSLPDYLKQHNVVAIANIDTRRLTRHLREKGAQAGCIQVGTLNPDAAIAAARDFPGLDGVDLAKVVSTESVYEWRQSSWTLKNGCPEIPLARLPYHVVVYDYGVKRNILRLLVDRGCRLTVVPAQTPVAEVLAFKPDGIFLSNGPGDPAACQYAVKAIKDLLTMTAIPLFGICLGHQLLALACGASTIKMKFGHHGANHPVHDLIQNTVLISSQNHGFAVDEKTLPANVQVTHQSLFDGSLQGVCLRDRPAFSFQGHPEASPGPHDVGGLFDHFIELIQASKKQGNKPNLGETQTNQLKSKVNTHHAET